MTKAKDALRRRAEITGVRLDKVEMGLLGEIASARIGVRVQDRPDSDFGSLMASTDGDARAFLAAVCEAFDVSDPDRLVGMVGWALYSFPGPNEPIEGLEGPSGKRFTLTGWRRRSCPEAESPLDRRSKALRHQIKELRRRLDDVDRDFACWEPNPEPELSTAEARERVGTLPEAIAASRVASRRGSGTVGFATRACVADHVHDRPSPYPGVLLEEANVDLAERLLATYARETGVLLEGERKNLVPESCSLRGFKAEGLDGAPKIDAEGLDGVPGSLVSWHGELARRLVGLSFRVEMPGEAPTWFRLSKVEVLDQQGGRYLRATFAAALGWDVRGVVMLPLTPNTPATTSGSDTIGSVSSREEEVLATIAKELLEAATRSAKAYLEEARLNPHSGLRRLR